MRFNKKIVQKTSFIFAVSLFSTSSQLAYAENDYGYNMDEAVNIIETEKVKLRYHQQYQQKLKQQKLNQQRQLIQKRKQQQAIAAAKAKANQQRVAVRAKPATANVANRPHQTPKPVVQRAPVTQTGGCTDCYVNGKAPARLTAMRKPATHTVAAPEADSLFLASKNGDVSTINRLLSQGININAMNKERETALHMAAAKGHYSTVIFLLNHGANINARTIKNWVPLHHAVRFRHANIANYLLKHGSSAGIRTSDNMSPVDMARRSKDQRMLNILGAR